METPLLLASSFLETCWPSAIILLFFLKAHLQHNLHQHILKRLVFPSQAGYFQDGGLLVESFGQPAVNGLSVQAVLARYLSHGHSVIFDAFEDLVLTLLTDTGF